MKDFLPPNFITNLDKLNVGIAFLLLFFLLLKESPKLLGELSNFTAQIRTAKSQEIENLKSLITGDNLVSQSSKEYYQEYLDKILFKQYYGIDAPQPIRHALFFLFQKSSPDIEWHDIKRAYRHLKFREGYLSVEISRGERNTYTFIYGVSIIVLLSSFFVLFVTLTSIPINSPNFYISLGIFLLIFAEFFLLQSLNYSNVSAKKIQKKLNKEPKILQELEKAIKENLKKNTENFYLEKYQIEFIEKYKNYGFKDKSELVRTAIERLSTELEKPNLKESAELYAEVYEEDDDLKELTESA